MKFSPRFVAAMLAAVLVAGPLFRAEAAPLTGGQRCNVGKLKSVATYASCRLKAEATAIAKGLSPDYARCRKKIDAKFPKLEASAGVMVCPSEGDLVDIRDRSDDYSDSVAILLSGGTIPVAGCGDGIVDIGEDCDVGNLDGETCATRGFYNGVLACGPGCTFDVSRCNATRFEDTGTTLIDHETGLEWEVKDASDSTADLSNPHDVDNTYAWASGASTTTQSGTLYSDFLARLNGVVTHATTTTAGCYAGRCDWRIPTIDELKSITVLAPGCGAGPCVQDSALLPNRSGFYWSNSSRDGFPTGAYVVQFSSGTPTTDAKTSAHFVRAVRSRD